MTASELAGQVKQVYGVARILCKDQVSIYYSFRDHTHTFKKLTFPIRVAQWPIKHTDCQCQVRLQKQDGKLERCHDLTVSLLSEEESLSPLLSAATSPVVKTHGLQHVVTNATLGTPPTFAGMSGQGTEAP